MNLFDVYGLFDVAPARALGCHVWDEQGQEYLDLYGGHAVISIGHSHPHYIAKLTEQLGRIGFYSNSVVNPLQRELAERIGHLSGYDDYRLFLCNSGAEANENALKLASFHTGRAAVVAFHRSFHGRTSGAVAVTDNPAIVSPFNAKHDVRWATLNDIDSVRQHLETRECAAVIVEGVQGCGGIHIPNAEFLRQVEQLCHDTGTMLILDEIQSGYGRTGRFYAHQHAGIKPDIVSMAKGTANGFPIGAIALSPKFEAVKGRLGTTFGGNYLAMVAALATADVYEQEHLEDNARMVGKYFLEHMPKSTLIKEVRGLGLMIGIEFNVPIQKYRNALLYDKHIFTGVAGQNMIRLLPPLCVTTNDADRFFQAFNEVLGN